jgi:hypothetical protein
MDKPKDNKKKELSPNHVSDVRNILKTVRGASAIHPLMVPSPDSPMKGNVSEPVAGDDQLIPAKTGEYVIPEPVVKRKGTQFFDNLIKKTLEELMPADMAAKGGTGTAETGFRWGGEVGDPQGYGERGERIPGATASWVTSPTGQGPTDNPDNPWTEPTPIPASSPNPFGQPDPNVFINREPKWAEAGVDPKVNSFFNGNPWYNPNNNLGFGYNPFGMSSNFPGSTMLPTYWDNQGYPFAIPYYPATPDSTAGTPNHIGQPKNMS